MVGLAALDAARDAGNRWIFPELVDEGLAPWGGVRYVCCAGALQPTHGVEITSGQLARGVASLAEHRAYTSGLGAAAFDPGEFLSWAARQAGPALGVELAVLFDVYMLIPDAPPPWS